MSEEPKKPKSLVGPSEASKLAAMTGVHTKLFSNLHAYLEKTSLLRGGLTSVFREMEASSAMLRSMTAASDFAKSIELSASLSRSKLLDPSVFKALEAGSTTFRALEAQSARWRSLTESIAGMAPRFTPPSILTEQVARSAFAWNTGISESLKRIGELGVLGKRLELSNSLLAPSLMHARFAEDTLSRLKEASGPRVLKALNASLNLVDAQHVANASLLKQLAPTFTDEDLDSSTWELNAPFVQREELLSEEELEDDEDIELVISHSPAAQETEQTRTVLLLTTDCNKASRTKGLPEIFKPTTRVLEVFGNLPWLIPHDERSFGEFVDGLYFVVYEGAGKDNLRFLQKHGGPLTAEECDVIWNIKTLRNKWLRHDADHGKDADINKSWTSLDECFRHLGLQGFPRTPSDYRFLHRNLLAQMKQFLSRLFGAI